MYKVIFTPKAQQDMKKIGRSNLREKCQELLNIIADNPYANPPPYEKLIGDLKGYISRRLNIQHRVVYEVDESLKLIRVYRMWTHYD
jgi:toxin YoeB